MKLFLSYHALIREVALGNVSEADLSAAVFYLNSAKEYIACVHHIRILWNFHDNDSVAVTHRTILRAVNKAEDEGRAVCHRFGAEQSFGELEKLLARVGVNLAGWEQVTQSSVFYPKMLSRVIRHFGLKDVDIVA